MNEFMCNDAAERAANQHIGAGVVFGEHRGADSVNDAVAVHFSEGLNFSVCGAGDGEGTELVVGWKAWVKGTGTTKGHDDKVVKGCVLGFRAHAPIEAQTGSFDD